MSGSFRMNTTDQILHTAELEGRREVGHPPSIMPDKGKVERFIRFLRHYVPLASRLA
jgi:hypothetical protein